MTKLYKITTLAEGSLFMMPKPGAETLEQDIAYYASQGVNKVVSLLKPEEIARHGLEMQAKVCEQNGIEYANFPIKDMDVPEQSALLAFLSPMKAEMEAGSSIAFHCHGGRGRAGTAAISLMLMFGHDLNTALTLAREGRQDPMVPVCDSQNEFLAELFAKLSVSS